jgi:hypothetical protein
MSIDPRHLTVEEPLHQIWTERLYQEFDNIVYRYRLKMRRPILRIEPMRSKWGTWDPLARTITLSSSLIEAHPWDAVIEILKHEMAHQLVTDVFGHDHRHGRHFDHACKVLRVADWARRASGGIPESIPHWKDRVLSEEEERLLKRVEKLLSLAGSSNEHEALLAMQRVQEIYARYNLARLKERRDASIVSLTINFRKQRIDRHESMICSILLEHFFVRIIYGRLYDAKALCEHRTVELIGAQENVLMAEYVYHFLWQKIRSLWEEYQARTGAPGLSKQDYMLGVLSGFRKKLAEGKEGVMKAASAAYEAVETTALVARGNQELEAFIQHRYPRLGKRSWSATYRDHGTFADGVEEGRKLVLHKGISGKSGSRGLLLEE